MGMTEQKSYDPVLDERRIQAFWDENQIYTSSFTQEKPLFTIDTPPPTLSGVMHLGHAFSYAQGDFIARYKRMRGFAVFYPFGTDDNGLPTERLVEKKKGVSAKKMPRDAFVQLVNETVTEELPLFSADWKRLGISADFSHAYSTIDPHCIRTSQLSFLDLYEKGLLVRKADPVSWCTQFQTAIAQAEFESIEQKGVMNTILFSTTSQKSYPIMTTRPELIPACVALAAHPGDSRYASLKDELFLLPFADRFPGARPVPLIFDTSVQFDKGTGLMMVCTFGDKEDVEKWRKHNLPLRSVLEPDGLFNALAGPYEGLSVRDARKAILDDLREHKLLLHQEEIIQSVTVYERSGVPVEYISSKQWFVKLLDNKEKILSAGKEINWYPHHMRSRFEHWIEGLSWDWIISRQRSYGVPFPVWYTPSGEVVLPQKDELPIDPTTTKPRGYGDVELIAETDVMDTWATSSVTPQIALGWSENSHLFDTGFPMSLRLQAHDIIRTWAFYTIAKSVYHHNSIPWKDIVISGHALDPKGKKMSKSKGNTVDPREKMSVYGADAVRYWAAGTKLGEDLPFQEKDLVTGKKTVNKIWNASRFASLHLHEYVLPSQAPSVSFFDTWLFSRFSSVLSLVTKSFDAYEYSRAKQAIDQFFWNDFCDNYLELVKDRLYNPDVRGVDETESAQYCLYHVLLAQIKVFAPILPHITEHVYQSFFLSDGAVSVHTSQWPVIPSSLVDDAVVRAGDILIQFLSAARKYKSERSLSMRAEIAKAVLVVPADIRSVIEQGLLDWKSASGVQDVEFVEGVEPSISFS